MRTAKIAHIKVPYHKARTIQCEDDDLASFIELIVTVARMAPYMVKILVLTLLPGNRAYHNGHRVILCLPVLPPEIHDSDTIRTILGHP